MNITERCLQMVQDVARMCDDLLKKIEDARRQVEALRSSRTKAAKPKPRAALHPDRRSRGGRPRLKGR